MTITKEKLWNVLSSPNVTRDCSTCLYNNGFGKCIEPAWHAERGRICVGDDTFDYWKWDGEFENF